MSPTDETAPDSEQTPEREGHERLDVDPARVALWGGAFIGGTALCALLTAVGYAVVAGIDFGSVFVPTTESVERPLPPQPRLERDPYALRRKVEAEARRRLEGWEWVDRGEGIARIPIERAMELVVERYRHDGPAGPPDAGPPDGDAGPAGTPDANSETSP